MDRYDLIILGTLIGFLALAFVLLMPVYLFLRREEETSRNWTKQKLAEKLRKEPPAQNGHPATPDRPARESSSSDEE